MLVDELCFSLALRWLSILWPNFWEMLPTCAIPCGSRLFLLNSHFLSLSFPAVVFLLVSGFKFYFVVSASQADSTYSSFFFFKFVFLLLRTGFSLIYWNSFSWDFSSLFLLLIPAHLSASIYPLPVRDQDPSIYHLIIIFGSFPNLYFSPLKSIIFSPFYKLCDIPAFHLHNLSWSPGFMALLTSGPMFKSDIGEGFEKHQISSIGSFLFWILWERKTC